MERAAHYPWAANTIRSSSQQTLLVQRSRAADPALQGTQSHQGQFLPSFVKTRVQKAISLCSSPKAALTVHSLNSHPQHGWRPRGRGKWCLPVKFGCEDQAGEGVGDFSMGVSLLVQKMKSPSYFWLQGFVWGEVAGPGCGCEEWLSQEQCWHSNGAFAGWGLFQQNFWVLQTA